MKKERQLGYKAFNHDWACLGFQYEVGKEYEIDGELQVCKNGFHYCKKPLDVLDYYNNAQHNKYAIVEALGDVINDGNKSCTNKLKIVKEISFQDLLIENKKFLKEEGASNTGDYSSASNTGYCSSASNTGNKSSASNTGNKSSASNTGYCSSASNTGYCSSASNTGDYSSASNTGNKSSASSTGDYSSASNTGYYSSASNTGNKSSASNTGYCSSASNTGYCSSASNTGDYSSASSTGDYSVALAWGYGSKAMTRSPNSYIVIVDYRSDEDYNIYIHEAYIKKPGQEINGTVIEVDTWYWFEDGILYSDIDK